jgi:hypothetical protein
MVPLVAQTGLPPVQAPELAFWQPTHWLATQKLVAGVAAQSLAPAH